LGIEKSFDPMPLSTVSNSLIKSFVHVFCLVTDMEELLGPKYVAKVLGISTKTLWERWGRGIIKAVKLDEAQKNLENH
jgi:hypothetical protein